MFVTCWSVKGGSGVSVVSAALATLLADSSGSAVLADFGGDQPAVMGMAEPPGPGLLDWCHSDAPADALKNLSIEVIDGLRMIPRGTGGRTVPKQRCKELAAALTFIADEVIVDAGIPLGGSPPPPDAPTGAQREVEIASILREMGSSLFVTKACYLALRRATRIGIDADGVVLVHEQGRSISRSDVADVLGLPVIGVVENDPAIARAVDSGSLARRLPSSLRSGLRRAG